MMSFRIEALAGNLGARVVGWQFEQQMSAQELQALRQALCDFGVLVFRGHDSLSDGQLIDFAQQFGPLVQGSQYFGDQQQHPEILRVNNLRDAEGKPLGTGGAEACDWHSDYAYLPQIGLLSFLNAQIVPDSGGRTFFAATSAGMEVLSAQEKTLLESRRAYHDTLAADRNIRVEESREKEALRGAAPPKPSAYHPCFITHPFDAAQTLYINPMLTRFIEDLPAQDSHRILEKCFAAITADSNTYAHDWQVGDLVVWDNIGMIHRRDSFDPHATRSMRQLTAMFQP
jgi:taurine dioxygenase/pentalenolactone F synthase